MSVLSSLDPAKAAAAAACTVLAVASLSSLAGQSRHGDGAVARDLAANNLAPMTIPVTVAPGDSLWTLAHRYGNPHRYIQDSIDTLAERNRIAATSRILPGQRLMVPVENPVELAQLETRIAHR